MCMFEMLRVWREAAALVFHARLSPFLLTLAISSGRRLLVTPNNMVCSCLTPQWGAPFKKHQVKPQSLESFLTISSIITISQGSGRGHLGSRGFVFLWSWPHFTRPCPIYHRNGNPQVRASCKRDPATRHPRAAQCSPTSSPSSRKQSEIITQVALGG